ncbi:hypothetical protein [Aeromonas rivipollensis]|uniref:hypothetical protein n=1 Tax=Aeromonas rivipollensis TaxID=948519 RepID=UPI00372CEDCD
MTVKVFRAICWLVVILLMAALLALPYLYYSEFGFLSKYSWHNNQSWANFGSFIGGTIGPIISCFAFFGVWKTYTLQNEQLQLTNKQRKSEDLQRLISSTYERIENILEKKVDALSKMIEKPEDNRLFSIDETIALLTVLYSDENKDPNKDAERTSIKSMISIELASIAFNIEQLSLLLDHQMMVFNENTVADFYIFRYFDILSEMKDLGVKLRPTTLKIFSLE